MAKTSSKSSEIVRRSFRLSVAAAVEPLLKAREAIARQIGDLDRKVLRVARSVPQVRRFMTVPGVRPITALCYLATIDDPTRFKKSRSVGATSA
jgi:transposase